jgi:tRNA threonylcarbamoyl adenosine modification protein YeaZ
LPTPLRSSEGRAPLPALLVIDTALAGLSVALLDGDRCLAAHHELIGRGHAEAVVPVVAAVLAAAGLDQPDAILVDIGPGSFTGLRIGIAAARALGLAWDVGVNGISATALVAAHAFAVAPDLAAVTAVLDAGRGQVYAQRFNAALVAQDAVTALSPADAAALLAGQSIAGPAAEQLGSGTVIHTDWPRAADAALLPAAARALGVSPLYVRAPDAKLPAGAAA